ncbi:major facilitator superfamily domain-containing protein [Fennellomyces sp. T-0311]|nr:major facilitator superfamily domain-containing protein [Fennellomyces sp. T-0311]
MQDLNMTESQYQWCLTSPFIVFFCLSIPISIVLRRWRPSFFLPTLILFMGGLTMCAAAAKNFAGLLAVQTVAGLFTSANEPAQTYYLSLWYLRKEFAQRVGYFTIAGTMASGFGGLIAYGISQIPTTRIYSWQWIYLIFGIPGVVAGIVAFIVLPDRPETAKFFTEKERQLAIERLAAEQAYTSTEQWEWKQVVTVLTDWKVYMFSLVLMLGSIIGSGTRLVLPSIIDGMGDWSEDISLALTTPPMIISCICTYFYSKLSDRWYWQRGYFLLGAYSVAMIGFFIVMFVPEEHVGVRYFGVCVLTTDSPVRYSWYSCNFSGPTRRAIASAIVFSFNAAGNAIGGQAYFDPPKYLMGHTIALSCFGLEIFVILALRIMLNRANKKREAMTPEEKGQEIEKYGGENLVGDRHPDFRYAL